MADEYIKREDALKWLEDSEIGFCDDEPIQTRNSALKIIKNIPAADVRPVVRCKDCKHNRGVTTDLWGNDAIECDVFGEYNPLDWFCAAGERENNDDKLL